MAERRFKIRKIIDKILKSIENNENVVERTVEILKEIHNYSWVGIYLVEGEDLVLKHFLGKPTEIWYTYSS